MAKATETPRSAEQLKEVAIFLKQADKLVREGSFTAALDEIAKARSRDPRNLYALAYEERVRSLVASQKDKKPEQSESAAATPAEPQTIPAALEHISNLAIVEAQRSAAVAAKQEQDIELRKKDEEDRKKNEEARRQAIEAKIEAFLARSKDYLSKGDFNRALDEIARAFLLDPANDKIHAVEDSIRKTQEETRLRDEQERLRKQQEDERKRQELLKAQMARMQQEKEEKRRKEEEARKQAQQQKISQYLRRAQELFGEGRLEEALSELAFVVVIDPLNEEVLNLERKIRDAQDNEQAAQMEQYRKREEEQRKKREAIIVAIQKHIDNAERLAGQQKWSEALRVITRAYVLDPVNDALQECEKRIQIAQEEALRTAEEQRRLTEETVRHQQEEELRRLEQAERERAILGESAETEAKRRADKEKVLQYLTRARSYFTDGRFEDALGEVALAFIINPFDEDVKRMEHEIITAQNQRKADESAAAAEEYTSTSIQEDETALQVSDLLAEASRFASDHEYSRALDEVAKAFILDPLNETIQKFETQIQDEFHEYQEELHKKQEEETRLNAVVTHLTRAKEFLEREAFDEALAEIAEGFSYDPEYKDLKVLEVQINEAYQKWQVRQEEEEKNSQIEDLLFKAKEQLTREHFDEALSTITKAIVLDPERESLKAMEKDIEQAQQAFEKRKTDEEGNKAIQKHLFRAKENRVLRSYEDALLELDQALSIDPSREDVLQLKEQTQKEFDEWKSQKEQSAKDASLKQHLRQARENLSNKVYDEALMEVALGLTIDPDSESLKTLEEDIIKAQADAEIGSLEQTEAAGESTLKDEEKNQLIWIHLRAADELQKQKEFGKALDELAKAYVIDPLNKEVKKAEIRIRQNEIRHAQQTGQTLKLIYPNEQAMGGS
jgi:tetratricopeptide (TPR) repeat protein